MIMAIPTKPPIPIADARDDPPDDVAVKKPKAVIANSIIVRMTIIVI